MNLEQLAAFLQTFIPALFSTLRDAAVTAAAIVAGYVGYQGLNTWRRQLTGNAEYQLAKTILSGVYEVRDRVRQVRSPFMSHPEEPDLPKDQLENMSREEKRWHAYAQAYQKVWNPIPAAKSRLDVSLWEAEALWGKEIVEKARSLNGKLNILLYDIQMHLQSRNPEKRHEPAESNELFKARQETLFSKDEGDKFAEEFDAIVTSIEEILRPHVASHYRR